MNNDKLEKIDTLKKSTDQTSERGSLFENIPFVDLKSISLNREVAKIIPKPIARKIDGICIGRPDDKSLVLAVKDPTQIYIYDTIAYATNNKYPQITLMRADPDTIDLAIEYVYNLPKALYGQEWSEWLETQKYSGEKLQVMRTGLEIGGKPEKKITGTIINKANRIIAEAISVGASDIHLESFEDGLVVRYRIDGVLHIMDNINDLETARALIKRIKVMANMDIAQDRVTQGGRISVEIGNSKYDLRVSIVPVPSGESIVLRLLNKGAFDLSLQTLGFEEDQLKIYQQMVNRPYGIILTSGPTGSGKSTTLFASLKDINRPDRKLLTVEDPIEYNMPGVVQVQVNLAPKDPEKKVTFSSALREFLRQDPDVILVGEIRDSETAEISVKAALTGHLVFSTIHTNDAVGIITRLKDMGLAPYLISATLIGGIAQRLVRRLCPRCKQPTETPDSFKEIIKRCNIEETQFYTASSCPHCRRTGFRGRIGLYEILVISDNIRDLIEHDATSGEIYKAARSEGMKNLLEDGVTKAAVGITSPDEIRRVCMMDIKV